MNDDFFELPDKESSLNNDKEKQNRENGLDLFFKILDREKIQYDLAPDTKRKFINNQIGLLGDYKLYISVDPNTDMKKICSYLNKELIKFGCHVSRDEYNTLILSYDKSLLVKEQEMRNYDTIVFDIGGVLIEREEIDLRDLRKLGIYDEVELRQLMIIYYDIANENDTATYKEVLEKYEKALPDRFKPKAKELIELSMHKRVCKYTIPLLKELKSKGYKLYYLSNASKHRHEVSKKKGLLNFLEYFDGGLISYKEGVEKPNPEFYNRLLKKYKLKASDCLFIDDNSNNIETAQNLGFKTLYYNNPKNIDLYSIIESATLVTETPFTKYKDEYEVEGKKHLSQFKQIKVTKAFLKDYAELAKSLKRNEIVIGRDEAYVWLNSKGKVVAKVYLCKDNYYNDGKRWIGVIEVSNGYRGYGLGKEVLDFAIKHGGNALGVHKDNTVALNMYKKAGFKISPESQKKVDSGKDKYYHVYLGEIPDSSVYESAELELPEDEVMNEVNIFVNEDNIECNCDTLAPNTNNNILFITGYSGAGKSTLMANLNEKYGNNIMTVAGDVFFFVCRHKYRVDNGIAVNDKQITQYGFTNVTSRNFMGPVLARYFDLYYDEIKLSNDLFRNKELFKYWVHFVKWLYKDTAINKAFYRNKIVVVEGIQISNTDPELYKDHALIIVGTSALTAWSRKANRDIFSKKKYDWKHIKTLFTMIPVYANDYNRLNNLEKIMGESTELELPEDNITLEEILNNTSPNKIYFTSDWHLFKNHYKHEANYVNTQKIIEWCRQNIKDNDVLLYLGDISFRWANEEDQEESMKIMASLPGIKVLILGNHDKMLGQDYFANCGFKYVFEEYTWKNYIFTHKPINMDMYSENMLNIHGHIHNITKYNTTDGKRNINVYPMYYDNKPVTLSYITSHIEELTKNHEWNWNVGYSESTLLEEILANDKSIPQNIIDLNIKLNNMEYGILMPGYTKIPPASQRKYEEDFTYYRTASPDQFIKQNGGACWDYVCFEDQWFDKYTNIDHECYYIESKVSDSLPTHTILIFKYNNIYYYFESSFKSITGIYYANNINNLISFCLDMYDKYWPYTKRYEMIKSPYVVYKYKANDPKMYNLNWRLFMDNIYKYGQEVNFKYNPNYKINKYNHQITESKRSELPEDEVVNEACKDVSTARRFVSDVRELAKKYDANFFVVTDGASGYSNGNGENNPAVKNARAQQIEWEKKNGFDPDEDWEKKPVNETILINNKDIEYNIDKFKNGDINIALIVGFSGSGKTTLGKELADSLDAEWYELDDVMTPWDFTDEELKIYGDLIYSFFNGSGKKYRKSEQWLIDNHIGQDKYEIPLLKDFLKYAEKYAKTHRNTRYIFDGVWPVLYQHDPNMYKDWCVIIKGTSFLKSVTRSIKRDYGEYDGSAGENVLRIIKGAPSRIGMASEMNKPLKQWSNYFGKLSISESAMQDSLSILSDCIELPSDSNITSEWAMASCNPIKGISKPFILKITPDNNSTINPKLYAFSPDIISDKYLVVNENAELEIVNSDRFNNCFIESYEFIGENQDYLLGKIYKAYKGHKIVDNTFFYTTLTGKPMLCEDQIDYDSLFRKVDLDLIVENINTELATLNENMMKCIYNISTTLPVLESVANRVSFMKHYDGISIKEDIDGYYFINSLNNRRSRSEKNIHSLTEAMLKSTL